MKDRRLTSIIIILTLLFQTATLKADSFLPEKDLPVDKLGINAFANDARFGSIRDQFQEVREVLGLRHYRVLFNWDDNVQSDPSAKPNFSFYDEILKSFPRGSRVLVILTNLPSWMHDSASPRKTFARKWVRKVIRRYRRKRKIAGFQIWNEPNQDSAVNNVMEFFEAPQNYLELLRYAKRYRDRLASRKKIIGAATTSISQNYPDTLNYNEYLKNNGIEELVDIWGVHYYGTRLETFLFGGVRDFLNSLGKPVWVTESGEKGVLSQLEYGRTLWPYLFEEVPGIKRIYIYQFTEDSSPEETYGLKNPSTVNPVSDLYIELRNLAE